MEIPKYIQDELSQANYNPISEMSKRHQIVYFGIGNKLVVWDYTKIK